MANDSGLYFVVRRLLDAKTRKAADAIINEHVGDDYLKISRELRDRIDFHRTKNQNSLYYQWLKEIAAQTGQTELEVRRYCKYQFGLPILFRNMPEQASTLRNHLGKASYEEKLKLMDLFAVSSLMNTTEFTEYMERIEHHFRPIGVQLSQPEESE